MRHCNWTSGVINSLDQVEILLKKRHHVMQLLPNMPNVCVCFVQEQICALKQRQQTGEADQRADRPDGGGAQDS